MMMMMILTKVMMLIVMMSTSMWYSLRNTSELMQMLLGSPCYADFAYMMIMVMKMIIIVVMIMMVMMMIMMTLEMRHCLRDKALESRHHTITSWLE